MHDIRAIRANPAGFDAGMARRGLPPAAERLISLDAARRSATTAVEEARAARNKKSREVGALKATGRHDEAQALIDELAAGERVSGDRKSVV